MTKLVKWGDSISACYGSNKEYKTINTGIELNTTEGVKLEANINGKVVGVGYSIKTGHSIKVKDESNLIHYFAKLKSIKVKIGDSINVGDFIGELGSVLHYQVSNEQNLIINPVSFMTTE